MTTVSLPGALVGGSRHAVSFDVTIPADSNSHQFYVLVDPDSLVLDRDRDNNATELWIAIPNLAAEAGELE